MDEGGTASPPRAPRRRRARPTVADVAALAGVSPMTVSRTINASRYVSPDVAARVADAVAALGYVPDKAARSLARGRQCTIGLLYANPSAAYLSAFLTGCLDAVARADAALTLELRRDGETVDSLIARLAPHGIDAVLLPPPLCDDGGLVEALLARGYRVGQVATAAPSRACTAVWIDDHAAMQAITAHLVTLGHRTIGYIGGAADQTASARRRAGFVAALSAAGIAVHDGLMAAGDFTFASGLFAARALLASQPRPTAIVASNDDMAAGAIAAAHQMGIAVPDALSVTGFDDSLMATSVWPELTTVRQPIAEMARDATEVLIAACRADRDEAAAADGAAHRCVAHELIVRGSTGAAGNAPGRDI